MAGTPRAAISRKPADYYTSAAVSVGWSLGAAEGSRVANRHVSDQLGKLEGVKWPPLDRGVYVVCIALASRP